MSEFLLQIATAFIHLLSPAITELGSPCLGAEWQIYVSGEDHSSTSAYVPMRCFFQPWALALCLLSIFTIFGVELIAFRWGSAKLAALGIQHGKSRLPPADPNAL